jgi:hypothetical protein
MPQYIAGVTATSNSTANAVDLFLEITAPSSSIIKIKRVRVGYGSGNQSAGIDNNFLIQLFRYTTTTAGSPTTLTYAPANNSTAGDSFITNGLFAGNIWTSRNYYVESSHSTVKVKNGSTSCVIGTGSVQIVDEMCPNGRALYEWLARDDDDMIVTQAGDCFCIALASQTASQVFTVTCDFVE